MTNYLRTLQNPTFFCQARKTKIIIVADAPTACTILKGYLQPDNYSIHYVNNGKKRVEIGHTFYQFNHKKERIWEN